MAYYSSAESSMGRLPGAATFGRHVDEGGPRRCPVHAYRSPTSTLRTSGSTKFGAPHRSQSLHSSVPHAYADAQSTLTGAGATLFGRPKMRPAVHNLLDRKACREAWADARQPRLPSRISRSDVTSRSDKAPLLAFSAPGLTTMDFEVGRAEVGHSGTPQWRSAPRAPPSQTLSAAEREAVLRGNAKYLRLSPDVHLQILAEDCEGWSANELAALCREAGKAARRDTSALVSSRHFSAALQKVRS